MALGYEFQVAIVEAGKWKVDEFEGLGAKKRVVMNLLTSMMMAVMGSRVLGNRMT